MNDLLLDRLCPKVGAERFSGFLDKFFLSVTKKAFFLGAEKKCHDVS